MTTTMATTLSSGAAPVRVGEAREPRELELARQVHEGAPAAELLEARRRCRAGRGVTGGGGHQARLPGPAAAGCAAGRRRLATSTASSVAALASASPNMRA